MSIPVEVETQAGLDAAVAAKAKVIHITGGSAYDLIVVRGSSHVEAWGSSHVVARGSSHVEARDSSHVEARDSSHVVAWDSSHVVARDSSHVVAWDSSHVVAWDSSHVVAWDSSHVEAWGSSHVVARDSSHVEAWDSSHVEARDSSHVEARGSSHVEAWGSSHVVARDSSHVVAWGEVTVSVQGALADVVLLGFAVAISAIAAKIKRRSKTSSIVMAIKEDGAAGWLDREGVGVSRGSVVLFKRVSCGMKTQEGTVNETAWTVGSTLTHQAWNPVGECGPGKFHACSRPYFCDEFRDKRGDRYIAIRIKVDDLKATDNGVYQHKIAFRKGTVLYECDRYGTKLESKP